MVQLTEEPERDINCPVTLKRFAAVLNARWGWMYSDIPSKAAASIHQSVKFGLSTVEDAVRVGLHSTHSGCGLLALAPANTLF